MKPLWIIPARGGSKGIPGKNIKDLGGKPLIVWTIEAARAAGATPSMLILSTDSREIADVAREAGLEVPYMRPAALGSDTTGSREVILDVMDWADNHGIDYDCIVLLQPTSPFRTSEDILKALAVYERHSPEIDMAVTVTEAATNPYYNCYETGEDGFLHVSKGEGLFTRRQDAPPCWEYNGAVYVINPQSIRTMALGEMPRRVAVEMSASHSLDLDTPLDWLVAEEHLKTMENHGN